MNVDTRWCIWVLDFKAAVSQTLDETVLVAKNVGR